MNRPFSAFTAVVLAGSLTVQTAYGYRDRVRELGICNPHPDMRFPIPSKLFGAQALAEPLGTMEDSPFFKPLTEETAVVARQSGEVKAIGSSEDARRTVKRRTRRAKSRKNRMASHYRIDEKKLLSAIQDRLPGTKSMPHSLRQPENLRTILRNASLRALTGEQVHGLIRNLNTEIAHIVAEAANVVPMIPLTPLQKRVLTLVARGKNVDEIAKAINWSEKGDLINSYLSHIGHKLGLGRGSDGAKSLRTQFLEYAMEAGFLSDLKAAHTEFARALQIWYSTLDAIEQFILIDIGQGSSDFEISRYWGFTPGTFQYLKKGIQKKIDTFVEQNKPVFVSAFGESVRLTTAMAASLLSIYKREVIFGSPGRSERDEAA